MHKRGTSRSLVFSSPVWLWATTGHHAVAQVASAGSVSVPAFGARQDQREAAYKLDTAPSDGPW